MKLCCLTNCLQAAALAAILPLGAVSTHATAAAAGPLSDDTVLQAAQPRPVAWEEAKKHKLRRAYWLLEQADRDYHGHRAKAIEQIRKAGDIIGMDLHGEGYGGEKQKWSDERLREARGLLEDIVDRTAGNEHAHIRTAVKELNKALETQ